MYARSSTVRGDPQAMDDGIAYVRDTVMPAVRQTDGNIGLSMLADRETGRCIVTSAWADAESMRASAKGVRAMRQRFAEIMGGGVDVDDWEIAVLHRVRDTHNGACTRVIWAQGDPTRMDRLIDTFRMSMIPRVEELPGFCSVSGMVDRQSGRAVTSVTYDSRYSMEQAEQPGIAMREEFTGQMGMEVTEVAVFDLVLAQLRVPETV
jgi:quinol monooxygenase YgiN